MKKVTLYIPCYNAVRYIREALDGVMNQTYQIDEILVIDDASTDETSMLASSYPVRIISHYKNRGLACARNRAFKEARNDYVAALDADCVPDAEWLEKLMLHFKDDDIVGVGGRVIEKSKFTLADCWREVHMVQHWGKDLVVSPPFLYGCNNVIQKKAVYSVNFYNEKFRHNYEDVDLSKRFYQKGYKLIYTPDAVTYHIRRDTISSVLKTYRNWHRFGYLNRYNINSRSKRIVARIVKSCSMIKTNFRKDLVGKNYNLLAIDFICLFYIIFSDVVDIIKTNTSRSLRQRFTFLNNIYSRFFSDSDLKQKG